MLARTTRSFMVSGLPTLMQSCGNRKTMMSGGASRIPIQLTTIKITQRSGIHRNMEGRGRGHNIPRVRRRNTPNRSTTTGHCFTSQWSCTSYKLPRSGIMRHMCGENVEGHVNPVEQNDIEGLRLSLPPRNFRRDESPTLRLACQIQVIEDLEYVGNRLHWYQREKTTARSNSIRVYRLKA